MRKRRGQVSIEFMAVFEIMFVSVFMLLMSIGPLLNSAVDISKKGQVMLVGERISCFVNKFAYTYGGVSMYFSVENYLKATNALFDPGTRIENNCLIINLVENQTGRRFIKTPLSLKLFVNASTGEGTGLSLVINIEYRKYLLWLHVSCVGPGGAYNDIADNWW